MPCRTSTASTCTWCAKAHAVPRACRGAAVAATKGTVKGPAPKKSSATKAVGAQVALLGVGGGLLAGPAQAVELPENRAEAMFHIYDGGGVEATGPALLIRKSVADKVSLTGSYYVDMVSNASID